MRVGRDQINAVLGEPLTLEMGEIDEYTLQLNRHMNVKEIFSSILLEGHNVQYNALGVAVRHLREDMKPTAQIFLLLILHNIKPKMHHSSAHINTTHLIHYILKK